MFKTFFRAVPATGHVPLARSDLTSLILRLGLAAIFIYHGQDKIFGKGNDWGKNWINTMLGMQKTAEARTNEFSTMQAAVAWGEFLGGIALALGILTRLAACGEIFIQAGAIWLSYINKVFEATKGGGGEYNFELVAMCLAVLILGAGRWSVDWLVQQRRAAARTALAPTEPAPAPLVSAPGP